MGNSASAADTSSGGTHGQGKSRDDRIARYAERLYLPWWSWPLPLVAAALLAAEIHMGYPGVRAWLPYVIVFPITAVLLLVLGKTKVALANQGQESATELWVGDAHVPVHFIGEVEIVDRRHKRKALGPDLDPAAFVVHRGWVGPILKVYLTDPEDPTPYWVFSTRHPDKMAQLIRDCDAA